MSKSYMSRLNINNKKMNTEIFKLDSVEVLDFSELSNLHGGRNLAEKAEAGKAFGVNCCNGSSNPTDSTTVKK